MVAKRHRDTKIQRKTTDTTISRQRPQSPPRLSRRDVGVRPAADGVGRAAKRDERRKCKAMMPASLHFRRSSRFVARYAGLVERRATGISSVCFVSQWLFFAAFAAFAFDPV